MEDESKVIEERKQKFKQLFTKNYNWLFYVAIILVIIIAVYIRSLPMQVNSSTGHPGLWDITTNSWTLGPDLDPFLFLRWAKYIVQNGHLMSIDTLRYVPLGLQTSQEFILMPYIISIFHKVAMMFGSTSVEQSAVIYPVFMFALGILALFLFVRKVFLGTVSKSEANIIAILSSLFVSIIPSLISRTNAGIPDKQGTSMFFLFISFYLFLSAWKSENKLGKLLLALSAGIFTGALGIYWGGYFLIFIVITLTVLVAFLSDKIGKNELYIYGCWIIPSLIIMHLFMARYTTSALLNSFYTGSSLALLLTLALHIFVYEPYVKNRISKIKFINKIPNTLVSFIISFAVISICASLIIGPYFFIHTIKQVFIQLINPAPTDRFNLTVAENRVPYLDEILGSFGPLVGSIPLFAVLFLIGSVLLFLKLFSHFEKKDRIVVTSAYVIFLICALFSRYSSTSMFNGSNFISDVFYAAGIIALVGSLAYYYFRYNKENKGHLLRQFDQGLIMLLILFFFTLISVKGAVRLILILIPPAAITASYLITASVSKAKAVLNKENRMVYFIIACVIVLIAAYSAYTFYVQSVQISQTYVPTSYTQQWQKAMGWVRTNTPENAVFTHWWDYGYWVQTMGHRATVVDGGNYIVYWDYLMGRYGLTSPNEQETLQFFYTHNVTNFLIDSSDIGKYPAFSSIGSDVNYDRYSWITTFLINPSQTQETKNSTLIIYGGGNYGGTAVDGDIQYTLNGTQVFLPAQQAGLGGIIIERDKTGKIISQPQGIFFYQGKQYTLPLRYAFDGNLTDYGRGIDGGPFFMPTISATSTGQVQVAKDGALLYISPKVIHSEFAHLYLFNEQDSAFKLVHSEDDQVVEQMKSQNATNSDFVFLNGVRGPIKIWEIHYPVGIQANSSYLEINYPNPALSETQQ